MTATELIEQLHRTQERDFHAVLERTQAFRSW